MKKDILKVVIFVCFTLFAIIGTIVTKHFLDAAIVLGIVAYALLRKPE